MRTNQDNLWIDLIDWADDEIGSVDELGHFAYIDITPEMIEDMVTELDADREDCPRPGHYIIHSDSMGFVRPWSDTPMTPAVTAQVWDDICTEYDELDN